MTRPLLWTAIGLLALLVPSVWWLKLTTVDPVVVDAQPHDLVQVREDGELLTLAVAAVMTPESTTDIYFDLAGVLTEKLGHTVRVVQRRSYAEINALLENGNAQLGFLCAGGYLEARVEGIPLEVLAVPYTSEGPVNHALVLVRADQPWRSMEDVLGQGLGFNDPLSLAGFLYPMYEAEARGYAVDGLLERALFTYSHDNTIHAVLDGTVAAGVVDATAYDYEMLHNPDHKKNLRVLERSESLPANPLVVTPAVDAALRARILQLLLNLPSDKVGRSVLERLGVERFAAPPAGLYEREQQRLTDWRARRGGRP